MEERKSLIKYTQLFINNEFVDSIDGQTLDVIYPGTEELICTVQRAGEKDAELAIKYAKEAFNGQWRKMSAHQRGRLMYKFADLIEQNAQTLAQLETLDNGKPLFFSNVVDIPFLIKTIRYYAGYSDKIYGETIPIEGDFLCYTRKEPVGLCAQIIPWNFPSIMAGLKLGPCLASGSVSILKPSEKTPLSALFIASLAKEAGFPPGVIQVLPGYGDVGQYLVQHPQIDKISFTGSTKVGFHIQQTCSKSNLKRITLELGGKSPNIICHDADIDEAVQIAKMGCLFNQGQVCTAGSRVFVHEAIYDKFVEKMVESVKQIKVGDPFEQGVEQGPQVDKIQFETIMKYIEQGKSEGAKLEVGGQRIGEKGYFIQPTIFTNVNDSMKIAKEEIFGPVMPIFKFNDYQEVIKRANDTQYGLAAGIVTKSIETYQKLANAIQAGVIYVNCYNVYDTGAPIGGYKASGIGRELGPGSVDGYLETKTIIVKRSSDTLP